MRSSGFLQACVIIMIRAWIGFRTRRSSWTSGNSAPEGITPEQIEQELRRLILDSKHTKITFDDFPYYLSERAVLITSAAYVHLNHQGVSKHTRNLSPANWGHIAIRARYLTDFSLKMQSKSGIFKKESVYSLFGAYSRQAVGFDTKSRNREGASNSLKHRRTASVSSDISSISSESSSSNPAQ
ncbi:hypothetical protein HAX54_008535 [Datura stramonium]|uniref:Uncharacterized protein n=1 Tax=Datura stramonium TaxID=4076 RepID=A0ABS8TF01_DATST|nr:hypothetical protein [Datura stramonium]